MFKYITFNNLLIHFKCSALNNNIHRIVNIILSIIGSAWGISTRRWSKWHPWSFCYGRFNRVGSMFIWIINTSILLIPRLPITPNNKSINKPIAWDWMTGILHMLWSSFCFLWFMFLHQSDIWPVIQCF